MSDSDRRHRGAYRYFLAAVVFSAAILPTGAAHAKQKAGTIAAAAEATSAPVAKQKKTEVYQQYFGSNCPGGLPYCTVEIMTVPAKRLLDIRNLSCNVKVANFDYITWIYIRSDLPGGGQALVDFVPVRNEYQGTSNFFAATGDTRFRAAAGEHLTVVAEATDVVEQINCTITGETIFLK